MNEKYRNASKALTFALALLLIIIIAYDAGSSSNQYSQCPPTNTSIIYTKIIKPGNATIIAYYYQLPGYSLLSISINGINTSLTLRYNYNYKNANTINPLSSSNISSTSNANATKNIEVNSINTSTNNINSIIPPISITPNYSYAAAFTKLEPLSEYNITIRYIYKPPCSANQICPEISPSFIMAGSVSGRIKTGLNGSITHVSFYGNRLVNISTS
ncbi:MAG: hypothetical protein ACP5T6_00435 [Candidatus Micrarchaeia archaeon]